MKNPVNPRISGFLIKAGSQKVELEGLAVPSPSESNPGITIKDVYSEKLLLSRISNTFQNHRLSFCLEKEKDE